MSTVTHVELEAKFDKLLDTINTRFDGVSSDIHGMETRLRGLEISFASSEGYRKAQAALWGIASGLFTSVASGIVIWLLTKD